MILHNIAKVDESTRVLSANQFRHYCLHDVTRAERILDLLFESDRTLPEILEKHLSTIRDYLTGGETFEEFTREVRKFDNHVVCGLVWTNSSISYRCRTCAINPCMSLCSDCFHQGNHQGHDANMFRSFAGGICDCGDMTVMNANGFCKHHGPQRIPNPLTPVKLLRYFATAEQSNDLQCCICRNKEINSPLGLIVRLVDTGVIGVRAMKAHIEHQSPLSTNRKLSNSQRPSSSELQSINIKSKDKNDWTCAQFYEEKIRSLLKIFSEKNVSKAVTISWRTGLLLDTCGHFIHFSCYQQHLQSHSGENPLETNPNIQFKCPMCRQTANGFICIPPTTQPMESNEDLLEMITDLIERNSKPCVSPSLAESIIDLTKKMYSMIHKNYRTIDQQEKQLNDDILALFLISILRFNLENDLLIRDTEHINRRSINRKTCFREFFYLCHLNYSHLSTDSSLLLWQRLIGVVNKQNTDEPIVPLLLSDPIALLLQILLRLPFNITKEFYQVIVQMLFNLTYVQSLFAIVMRMNLNEREIWSNHQSNQIDAPHLKTMAEYLQIICWKFSQSNLSSEINESEIRSLESIHASIQEHCANFIQIVGLIQHHLYQPMNPGCEIQFDELWNHLIRELQLYGTGEPYWFDRNSVVPLLEWLDEMLIIDQQQWKTIAKIARSIPSFYSPRFIELPKYYSDLLRISTRLHCSHCHKLLNNPMLCLICGIIYPCGHFERKCCDQQTYSMKEHLMQCSGGVNISINIDSTKTFIQRQRRYTYWSSLYLDEHGEEDLNLRRGRILYLNADRLRLLYSAWISSNLDQITHRWAIDTLNF